MIKNDKNNKIYIGSSVNIEERWKTHRKQLKKGNHHSTHLQRSWNKYGEDNFTFSVIEYIEDINALLEKEQYWLDKYKSYEYNVGYNECRVAGSRLGCKFSDETKKLLSEIRKGFKHKDETKIKISNSNKGKKMNLSSEQLEAMSERMKERVGELNYFYGKKHTDEAKAKISEANKGRKHTEEFKKMIAESNARRVISDETRQKLSNSKKKENLSEDTLKKLSLANKGESNPNSKLNEESVTEIKTMLKEGITQQKIADKYGVSRALIGKIKNGQIWNHVIV